MEKNELQKYPEFNISLLTLQKKILKQGVLPKIKRNLILISKSRNQEEIRFIMSKN